MVDKIEKITESEVTAPVAAAEDCDTKQSFVTSEDFAAAIAKLGDLIADIKKPAAQEANSQIKVAPEVTKEDVQSQTENVREALQHSGLVTIEVDMEKYITQNTRFNEVSKVQEAFTATGGSSQTGEFPFSAGSNAEDTPLVIRPSAESFIPVRQWLNVKVLPQGTTETVFYFMDSSLTSGFDAAQNAVIGSGTLPEQNKTISNLPLKVTTQVGYQTILNATDLEDSKFDLADAFRTIAARRKLESELTSTIKVLREAKHGAIASGDNQGANTAGKAKIIRTASSTGVTDLKIADILNIVEYYKQESYDSWGVTSGATPVMLCSIDTWAKLFAEVVASQAYGQFFVGSNVIQAKVQFESIFGITLVPTQQIATATSGTNVNSSALCFLPRYSICMATKRDLSIKFQEETTKLLTTVVASYRDAFGLIDQHSVIRYDVTTTAGAISAN